MIVGYFFMLLLYFFQKDKLKFDAVPTENGPYCNDPEPAPDPEQSLITPEDIEIDQLTCIEKQANYSVKYGDFLINSEVELLNVKSLIDNPLNTRHETQNINEENDEFQEIRKSDSFTIFTHRTLPRRNEKKLPVFKNVKTVSPLKVTSPLSSNNIKLEKPNNKIIEIEISPKEVKPLLITNNEAPNVPKRNNKIKILSEKTISEQVKVPGKLERVSPTLVLRARNKRKDLVQTIDKQVEDTSSNTVTINDIFSLFSPSTAAMSVAVNDHPLLEPSQNYQTNFITGVNENFVESKPVLLESQDLQKNTEVYLQVLPVTVADAPNEQASSIVPVDICKFQSTIQSTPKKSILNQTCEVSPMKQLHNSNKIIESSSPSTSISKNKIPPERVAAIEEKRKFNKKLRDMIEFCLDELEDPDKKNESGSKKMVEIDKMVKMPERRPNNIKRNDTNVAQINTHSAINVNLKDKIHLHRTTQQADMVNSKSLLQKSQTLKTADSYISILETRLQKMEDLLLQKIDQNSLNIAELKKTFCTSTAGKKSTLTQTSDNEEAYKKQLYQEISKYLSPNVNSSVYEELFLNRFTQRKSLEDAPIDLQMSPPKRRRRLR